MRHLVLVSLVVVGCGPARVRGAVDGESVGGARDAFYDTLSIEVGPLRYESVVVLITDFAEGCEVYEELTEALVTPGCEERCEEVVEVADEYRLGGKRLWTTTIYANTTDGVDDDYELDPALGNSEFTMSYTSWDGEPLLDVDACEEACEDDDLLAPELENGEDGELTLEEDEDLVRGRFDVSFGGDNGLSGSFTARPCDMGGWIGL